MNEYVDENNLSKNNSDQMIKEKVNIFLPIYKSLYHT